MKLDLEALKAAALAATPGEWRAGNAYNKPFIPNYQVITEGEGGPYVILEGNTNFLEDAEKNVAYVATANPAAVLALVARLEKAEADLAFQKQVTDAARKEQAHLQERLDNTEANIDRLEADAGDVLVIRTNRSVSSAVRVARELHERTGALVIVAQPDSSIEKVEAEALRAVQAELRRIYNEQAEQAGWKP